MYFRVFSLLNESSITKWLCFSERNYLPEYLRSLLRKLKENKRIQYLDHYIVCSVSLDSLHPWTVARLYSLSTEFSRPRILEWLPCSPTGIFPTQGSNLCLITSVLAGGFFCHQHHWEAVRSMQIIVMIWCQKIVKDGQVPDGAGGTWTISQIIHVLSYYGIQGKVPLWTHKLELDFV